MRDGASYDIFSPEKRSAIMRAVKSENTKPEVALRKKLHALGLRYRLNVKSLPGKPDLVFAQHRCVLFVHGCFWHGHDCKRGARIPKTNRAYWVEKIDRNKKRDARIIRSLTGTGWRSVIVWECTVPVLDYGILATEITH